MSAECEPTEAIVKRGGGDGDDLLWSGKEVEARGDQKVGPAEVQAPWHLY